MNMVSMEIRLSASAKEYVFNISRIMKRYGGGME